MPSPLDSILEAVKRNVERAAAQKGGSAGGGGLLSQLGGLLTGRKSARGPGGVTNVKPASEDPYGDPADQPGGYANVKPASEDPYGDPADQETTKRA